MKRRILAALLSLCMVLTLIPLTAAAEETETAKNYVSLGDSIPAGYDLGEGEKAYPAQLAETNSFQATYLAESGLTSEGLLEKMADETVLAALKEADVVTVTVGGNDLMNALYSFLAAKYNANPELTEEQKLDEEKIQALLMKGDATILGFAVEAVKDFSDSEEAQGALSSFAVNLAGIVTAIQKANPEAAIYVTNQYNPYTYVAAANATNPLVSASLKTVAEAFDSGVQKLNSTLAYAAVNMKTFTVVDVYTPFQEAEENPCNAEVSSLAQLNLDFHPNAYGQSLIAQAVDEAITPTPFTDVNKKAWYYPAVRYAYRYDLMIGVSDTSFDPSGSVTRAAVAQMLYNLEGQPEVTEITDKFSDVGQGQWYDTAITWAAENGVVAGNPDGTFQPTQSITREAFAMMLYNYAVYKKYDVETLANLDKFPDRDQVSGWAYTALAWANGKGLINGTQEGDETYLAPDGATIRAQAASILMNFRENVVTAAAAE